MSDAVHSPPFEIGQRITPSALLGWNYLGLSGRPGEPNAVRRYGKGMWFLELSALINKQRPARVLSLRTESEDRQWWLEHAKR
jgi:hypothetical protein